jgi:hypothetical protein
MDAQERQQRIARAKELLRDIHHVPIATVNADGSPHSSPVLMAFDERLHGYWASGPETQHSGNIARDPRVFLVLFDSRQGHSGLYIAGRAAVLGEEAAVAQAFARLDGLKRQLYGDGLDPDLFSGRSLQRLYVVTPLHLSVNKSERNDDGAITRDRRYEIQLSELFG